MRAVPALGSEHDAIGPFVGRRGEIEKLRSALALLTRERRGGIIWVRGAAGLGKSHLLARAREEAERLGVPGLHVRSERRLGGPFPLIEAIDVFLASLSPEAFMGFVDGGILDLLPVLLRREPALKGRSWARGIKEAAPLAAEPDRLRLHHTLMRILAVLAAPAGILITFDDLDQAAAESREIVRFVSRTSRREAVLIVASSLAGSGMGVPDPERRGHLRRLASDMFGIPPMLVLTLPPLTPGDISEMLSGLLTARGTVALDATSRQELARAIWSASVGQPQLARVLVPLTEALGIVERSGASLRLADAGALDHLPRTARDLAQKLREVLPPRRLALLEALAAYTAPCEETDLVQISGIPPREVREELIACVRLGILGVFGGGLGPGTIGPYGQPSGPPYLVFVLKELRELLLEEMNSARRRSMHRRIADLIERRPGAPRSLVAFHRIESGEHVKGFEAALWAGLEAKNNYRNTEALELLGKAVAIAEDAGGLLSDQQVTEALEALADVLMLIGRWPEALEHYDEATVRALKADSRVGAARNHRKSGELLQQMGQLDDARDAYERGLTLLEEGEPSPGAEGKAESAETAVIHAALGFLLGHLRGEYGRGIALLEKALEIGRRLGDGPLQARALNSIGVILNDKGDWEVAVEAYERALHLNEIHGDKLGASANYNNLAIIFEFKGELSQAVTYYRKSLKLDQSMDNLRGVGIDFNNLGSLCFKMGQWTRALGYIGKSRLMALQLGDLALVALAETNLGEVRLHRGDFAVADQHLRRAVEIWKELERADAVAETYAMMGSLCFRARKLGEAEAWFEMADEIATKRDFKIVQAEIARSMAELALAKGDVRGSEDLCVKASRLAHKLSLDDVMGDIYGVFGDVKAAQGDAREALGFFRKSLEVFRRKRIPYKLATALYRYGHHLSREQEDGRPFIEKSLQIFERLGAREDAARARHALGIAGSAGGRE